MASRASAPRAALPATIYRRGKPVPGAATAEDDSDDSDADDLKQARAAAAAAAERRDGMVIVREIKAPTTSVRRPHAAISKPAARETDSSSGEEGAYAVGSLVNICRAPFFLLESEDEVPLQPTFRPPPKPAAILPVPDEVRTAAIPSCSDATLLS